MRLQLRGVLSRLLGNICVNLIDVPVGKPFCVGPRKRNDAGSSLVGGDRMPSASRTENKMKNTVSDCASTRSAVEMHDVEGLMVQAKIVSQYIKVLSFKNAKPGELITRPDDRPNMNATVEVVAVRIESDLFETAIAFKASATNDLGPIYTLETTYAGLLKTGRIEEQALELFLLVCGPTMIFPSLRRLIADVTREGGFVPLLVDPIDFGELYKQRSERLDI